MTNTEIVKSMYEAFGRGDIPALLKNLADNVDWVCPGPASIPTAGKYHGPGEVAGFFRKVAETTDFDQFKVEQYVEQGDMVVALGLLVGRSKPLQKEVRSDWAMAFTLSGGKVTRFVQYTDTAAMASAFTASATAVQS